MKFVIQRVLKGNVKVENKIVGEIEKGLVVLIGFTSTDKKEDLKFVANKLLNIRLWDCENGVRWKESVKDKNFSLLIVSQFTLYSFLKGNKPDFHYALDPNKAIELYDEFLQLLKGMYIPEKIQSGIFGAYMHVDLINDGPVTINWEYPEINNNNLSNNKTNDNKAKEINNNNNHNSENKNTNTNTNIKKNNYNIKSNKEKNFNFENKEKDNIIQVTLEDTNKTNEDNDNKNDNDKDNNNDLIKLQDEFNNKI
jgi:D-tyrosyl-tRNA(Tyr) deacylase